MKEFTDLHVWQEAHRLTVLVYAATRAFPRDEIFGLTSQVRRAVASVEANVAEGHGRFSDTEFHQFCNVAKGSLTEAQCHLMVARDLGYLSLEAWQPLHQQSLVVRKLLQAFMRHLRGRNPEPRAQSPERLSHSGAL
jgi:four helix bundle protein